MPSAFHFIVLFVVTEYLFLQESSVPGESLLILVTVKIFLGAWLILSESKNIQCKWKRKILHLDEEPWYAN